MRSRWFLAALLVLLIASVGLSGSTAEDAVRIAVVTDVHAHDADSPVEGKVMTNYAERLSAFTAAANAWPADRLIELGDLVNGAFVMGGAPGDTTRIAGLLEEAVALLSAFDGPIDFVAGNHDLYDLSKQEFLAATGTETTYYSMDVGAYHVVILDAEFEDPSEKPYDHVFMRVKCRIPGEELAWLQADLAATAKPTIVCVHQPIDSTFDTLAGGPPIVNHLDVQRVLRESGRVIAVFQGHDHENRYSEIDGIHYITFAAMVDHTVPTPPSWAQITLDPAERSLVIDGYGLQQSYRLSY